MKLKWIGKYISIYKKSIFQFLSLEILCSLLSLAASLLLKEIIDHIVGFSISGLFVWVFWYVILQCMEVLMHYGAAHVHLRVHHTILHEIQLDVYETLPSSAASFGYKITCLEKDVSNIADTILNIFPKVVTSFICFIGAVGILFHYDWQIGLLSLFSVPVIMGMYAYKIQPLLLLETSCKQVEDETMDGFHQNVSGSALKHLQHKSLKADMDQFHFQSRAAILLFLLGMAIQYICYAVAVFQFLKSSITVGTLILFFTMISKVFNTLQKMIEWLPALVESSISYARIQNLKTQENE